MCRRATDALRHDGFLRRGLLCGGRRGSLRRNLLCRFRCSLPGRLRRRFHGGLRRRFHGGLCARLLRDRFFLSHRHATRLASLGDDSPSY